MATARAVPEIGQSERPAPARLDAPDAYREALTAVPPNAAWDSVLRCLRAGIEYQPDPSDSGSRVRAPEVFLEVDAERAELRAVKRAVLESEITRRALMASTH